MVGAVTWHGIASLVKGCPLDHPFDLVHPRELGLTKVAPAASVEEGPLSDAPHNHNVSRIGGKAETGETNTHKKALSSCKPV